MQPKKPGPSDHELFRMLLENMIDPGHALGAAQPRRV